MGFSLSYVIAVILWFTLSTIAMIDYIPYIKDLEPADRVTFFLIFAIGGPIFGINQVLTTLLDCILPEGWDDDDDFNSGH